MHKNTFAHKICIFGLLLLWIFFPPSVFALPGSHTYTNSSNGDVFLGGNYIELGISKYGSFGTTTGLEKPAGFFGTAARNNIGMSSNAAGFDTAPDTRIDYFLPGTPEERWVVGYKVSGVASVANNGFLVNYTQVSNNTVTNQSSGNALSALSVGTFNSKLKVSQTISFSVDDKYFKNSVKLENVGAENIDSVRYMRTFDPDNTVDKGGSYSTNNSIINTFVAGDGKAVVRADTSNNASDPVHTTNGTWSPILFYTNDSRARVSYGGFGNTDPYAASVWDSAQAKGSATPADSAINIVFDVGTIVPGSSQTVIYYTSLDNRDFSDVIADIEQNKPPDAPASLGPSSYVNGSATASAQPKVSFSLSDPDATNSAKYQIQIDNNSNFSSPEVDYTSALDVQGVQSFTVGQAVGNGGYANGSQGQQLYNGSYYWQVKAYDDFNLASSFVKANSGNVAFVVNTASPDISNLSSSVTDTSLTVTWDTADSGSSRVDYGLVPTYGFSSYNATLLLDHTVVIADLKPCARYFYKVTSVNNAGTQSVSDQKTVTTTGCAVSSIQRGTETNISNASSGSLQLINNNSSVTLSVPVGATSLETFYQINALNAETLAAPPDGKNLADGNIFDLIAVDSDNTQISVFVSDLTFTVRYGSDTESDFDENTLDVYTYSGSLWSALGCQRDTSANTLTCPLEHFSTYAVFGVSKSASSDSSSSSSVSGVADIGCEKPKPAGIPDLFQIDVNDSQATLFYTPVNDNNSNYYISFSEKSLTYEHGTLTHQGRSTGVLHFMVNYLKPNTTYYFRVRGENGCMPGEWSNEMKVITRIIGITNVYSYYRYGNPVPEIASAHFAPVNEPESVLGDSLIKSTEEIVSIINTPTPLPTIDREEILMKSELKRNCFYLWCW